MNKRWILIGLTGLAAMIITTGAALAQAATTTPADPAKSFAGRVATILGIEQSKSEP